LREFLQRSSVVWSAGLLLGLLLVSTLARGSPQTPAPRPVVKVPRVARPPTLEDFLGMKPSPAMDGKLAKIQGFVQRTPRDGAPPNQRTDVYLGYDDKNFYAIFVAFDNEPKKVRARMTTRDNVRDDERMDMFLDTFHDYRHAFVFTCNPFGIQLDGRWDEGARSQYDSSFDTVWYSRGKLTDRGYVIWMKIPFKSLRFPPTPQQTWGILFIRWIPRINGSDAWPQASTRVEGRLNQAAVMEGLENISPGRNAQIIPYAFTRSFRALDTRDPLNPHFTTDRFDPDAGLDAKAVFKDSLVLDVAANPDFSQVESDEPQVTVNQRFEVFFPEKRPFFLENSSFFETPMTLFFTRRIADPQFGIRLTGKKGPYAIGALFADDQSPGRIVPPGDPLFGKRAHFGIFRLQRDIFKQSTVGAMYTDREFAGGFNRVGALDTRLKLTKNWVTALQAVASSTDMVDGTRLAGPAYKVNLRHTGYQFFYNLDYDDRSPGFFTEAGFLADQSVDRFTYRAREIYRPSLRTDVRSVAQFVTYRFRPEGKHFISWGPTLFLNPVWDHRGTRLDMDHDVGLSWEFTGQTLIEVYETADREVLRPQDFAGLTENRGFYESRKGLFAKSDYYSQATFRAEYSQGTRINFVPPAGEEPSLGNVSRASLQVVLRPLVPLRIENTYLLERLTDRTRGDSIFNNHIVRSKWSWQFTRELSLRVILQYNTVLANPRHTALDTTKNFNGDFLLTYQVNAWTALYVGYNGNLQNLNLIPTATGREIVRTPDFLNDANQFFVKFSYLVRF
jgi:hypothetical protein